MISAMVSALVGLFSMSAAVFAAGPGPCKQIEMDCAKAGYVVGEAKEGKGMWWDCMCPLIAQGFPEPAKNVLQVPSDAGLVPACRQHPHGQEIMTRCAGMLAKKNAKQQSKVNKTQGH